MYKWMNFKLTGFILGNLGEDLNNVNISLLFFIFFDRFPHIQK
ncbi:hypothetical protein P872_05870 [Rhodonellum psychrophilum GCM71 = DSM 17998]|uniref:Uncharacterized protein n=1 Tax=Rhodonellum psychrophilum GCM71 = DSM 17998 TaxID=1123057 RepID=U5C2Y6_9BACT|nr:hypothetical protein P872_05870 [Rhodonellum psychrophilum GCM71 = DSM 17998]